MDPISIFTAVATFLKLLEWIAPQLGKAFEALLELVRNVREQAAAGDAAAVGVTLGDAAAVLGRAVDVARERLPLVQGLDFGTGNVTAEKMLKLDAIAEGVKSEMQQRGEAINKTIAVTAAQLAFAAKRADDPGFGKA